VLLWNFYVLPHYISSTLRRPVDRFSRAEPRRNRDFRFPDAVWYAPPAARMRSDLEEFSRMAGRLPPHVLGSAGAVGRRVASREGGRFARPNARPFVLRRPEISPDCTFRLMSSWRAQGGLVSTIPWGALQHHHIRPSIRSTLRLKARRPAAWIDFATSMTAGRGEPDAVSASREVGARVRLTKRGIDSIAPEARVHDGTKLTALMPPSRLRRSRPRVPSA